MDNDRIADVAQRFGGGAKDAARDLGDGVEGELAHLREGEALLRVQYQPAGGDRDAVQPVS